MSAGNKRYDGRLAPSPELRTWLARQIQSLQQEIQRDEQALQQEEQASNEDTTDRRYELGALRGRIDAKIAQVHELQSTLEQNT